MIRDKYNELLLITYHLVPGTWNMEPETWDAVIRRKETAVAIANRYLGETIQAKNFTTEDTEASFETPPQSSTERSLVLDFGLWILDSQTN
ncbi:MAG: hypothetical protein JSV26_08195, partial [bacterium]